VPYKCFGDIYLNQYASEFPSDVKQVKELLERCVRTKWPTKESLASQFAAHGKDIVGLSLALVISAAWFFTLPLMFAQPTVMMPNLFKSSSGALEGVLSVASVVVVMATRTWITTGLFVTVHDAIHGQVSPSFKKLNHVIGSICAFCYASFSYKLLYRDHWRHHLKPISVSDPDWYPGGFSKWLMSFMGHYSTFWQLFWESFQFWSFVAIGQRIFHIDFSWMVVRVALIWAIPSLLSGMQLFYFGTYLPHKDNPESPHHARSNKWPYALSLLSCFHFGACHEEHHAFPLVPWWELPSIRAQSLASRS